ncbi:MAG TPA: GDP-mannose 4,6-dehydratase [Thiotrichaceae bacterium]|jgi:GDPmannose 4,6-dehydratase|nr:GDP-mannose 4,6-dehydratase [Thiotrichaceae bacterium]
MKKRALITGISGQDGAFLSQFLLEKNYEIYGAYRRSSSPITWRLNELGIDGDVKMVPFELLDYSNILSVIGEVQPDEIYNLAAQSFVKGSFEKPIYTADVDAVGVLKVLEAIRVVNPEIKFYQASTSELFGVPKEFPQTETTPFYPRSPYSAAKLFAHTITINYREAYGLHASAGILFNHESEFRGIGFVTRKITSSLASIKQGNLDSFELGNIYSKRDWGYAKDYVSAMWEMLQQEKADEYVIATGESHTIKEFITLAAASIGFDLEWSGEGVNEYAIDKKRGKKIITINEKYFRPSEVDMLQGDISKAKEILGWEPTVTFEQLAEKMAVSDYERVKNGKRLV